MLIVPELQRVYILIPRTGSGTFYREMRRVYPKAMLLYRHMEADGCPRGYDRWERVGFVRHPLTRMWSLYNFLKNFAGGAQVQGGASSADAERIRRQVDRPFEDWLLNNTEPFTTPLSLNGEGSYWPVLSRINPSPENKISQRDYIRPDLGGHYIKFQHLREHMLDIGLDPNVNVNMTVKDHPPMSKAIVDHILRYMEWDLEQGCERL